MTELEQQILEELKTTYFGDVANNHKLPKSRVYSIWRKHNPKGKLPRTRVPRKQRAVNPERDQDIVALRSRPKPMPYRKIGEKWGITSQRAHRIYQTSKSSC